MTKWRSLFCLTLVFLFFAAPDIAFAEQEVYLLSTNINIQDIGVKELSDPNLRDQHIKRLINNCKFLIKIYPQLAYQKFEIDWIDSGKELSNLPRLIIAKNSLDNTYRLFALDPIKEGTVITEYIDHDKQHVAAADFVLNLPNSYNPNAELQKSAATGDTDNRIFLIATRNILPIEQISSSSETNNRTRSESELDRLSRQQVEEFALAAGNLYKKH